MPRSALPALVGKTCEVEVEDRKWTGNDGKEKDGYRVTFRGYHALTAAQAATQQAGVAAGKGRGTDVVAGEDGGADAVAGTVQPANAIPAAASGG